MRAGPLLRSVGVHEWGGMLTQQRLKDGVKVAKIVVKWL